MSISEILKSLEGEKLSYTSQEK